MDDEISVGDRMLHIAIDYWKERALKAEAAQPQVPDYEVVEKAMRLFRKEFIGQDCIKLWESCWLEAEEKSESAARKEGK